MSDPTTPGGEDTISPPSGEPAEAPLDADQAADAPDPAAAADPAAADPAAAPATVEDLVADLERVSTERDEYLDSLRRLQAEFENYRKAVAKREADAKARANDGLVLELLPVLDACDGAAANDIEAVAPVQAALMSALERQGLEKLVPTGEAFDPEQHEAVIHEEGDGADGPVVAEVLRVGYGWKGRVVRPAMVKVRG
ncbi:MAG: nucleotide exchange factor GrpE [Acidimicrobiales bacterium]